MFENAVAVFMVGALIIYALMGGADFGGGFWDFCARGPRALRQREAIARAIGPIWEANHVWLILVIVLLFSGFPVGFAAIMTALNIPLTLMLFGIVLRGSTFAFRKYDRDEEKIHRRWSVAFGTASVFTPLVQGMTLGALATGRIRFAQGSLTSGYLAGWLTPFALACGIFALALFAFLAATYLTVDTIDAPDLQNDFRTRALWSGGLLWPIAGIVFVLSKSGAPDMFRGLTNWWAPYLLGMTILLAIGCLLVLWQRHFLWARAAAAGEVTLVLGGWSLAHYPHLIMPDLTLHDTAAPAATLRLLLIALCAGAVLLLPSLFFLFRIFKGSQIIEPKK
ncbi:MAG: cytochrome d ubiquinol oxidase subunit II [Chthoniobacterales bacterium]|nr:cytochrome d ubiquinol oxidase subunit II [Chthoniobacterales bacterium]